MQYSDFNKNETKWYEVVFTVNETKDDVQRKVKYVVDTVGWGNIGTQSKIDIDYMDKNEYAATCIMFKCSPEQFEDIKQHLSLREVWAY